MVPRTPAEVTRPGRIHQRILTVRYQVLRTFQPSRTEQDCRVLRTIHRTRIQRSQEWDHWHQPLILRHIRPVRYRIRTWCQLPIQIRIHIRIPLMVRRHHTRHLRRHILLPIRKECRCHQRLISVSATTVLIILSELRNIIHPLVLRRCSLMADTRHPPSSTTITMLLRLAVRKTPQDIRSMGISLSMVLAPCPWDNLSSLDKPSSFFLINNPKTTVVVLVSCSKRLSFIPLSMPASIESSTELRIIITTLIHPLNPQHLLESPQLPQLRTPSFTIINMALQRPAATEFLLKAKPDLPFHPEIQWGPPFLTCLLEILFPIHPLDRPAPIFQLLAPAPISQVLGPALIPVYKIPVKLAHRPTHKVPTNFPPNLVLLSLVLTLEITPIRLLLLCRNLFILFPPRNCGMSRKNCSPKMRSKPLSMFNWSCRNDRSTRTSLMKLPKGNFLMNLSFHLQISFISTSSSWKTFYICFTRKNVEFVSITLMFC